MTLVACPPFIPLCEMPSIEDGYLPFASSYIVLDASTEYAGYVGIFPKTETISKIGVRLSTVSGPQLMRASLETVDASTGYPTGTLYATGASGTFTPASNTSFFVALNSGSGVSVTKGDRFAITTRFDSTAGTYSRVQSMITGHYNSQYPGYRVVNTGSDYKTGMASSFALINSDGDHVQLANCHPLWSASTNHAWSDSSNPDRRGLRFKVPFKCVISGVAIHTGTTLNTFKTLLYSGTTVLAGNTITHGPGLYVQAPGGNAPNFFPFESEITLDADTEYRIVVLPTSSSNVTLYSATVTEDGSSRGLGGTSVGKEWYYTSCNGTPGTWNDDTATLPMMSPVIVQIDNGAAGGGDFPDASNVTTDDTTNGVSGTLTLPAAEDVESGVQYGGGGTEFTGTLVVGGGGGAPVVGGRVVRR